MWHYNTFGSSQNRWHHSGSTHQLFATISCYLSVLIVGTCFVWMSPYATSFTSPDSEIQMSHSLFAWLTSTVGIGEVISSLPSGILADRMGRKTVLLSVGPMCAITWLMAAFTRNIIVLFIVRLVQGIAQGLVFTVVPIYIAEISSPKRRGTLGGYFTVFWNLGLLYAYCTAYFLSYEHYILSLTFLPLLYFVTYLFMPESPYYYFMAKNKSKAIASLAWLRHGEDIEEECKKIEEAVEEDMSNWGNWEDLVANKSDRRILLIVVIICISRYLTGMDAFVAYAKDTFTRGTQGLISPDQLSVVMGVIFAVTAFLSSSFSDSVGRRKLLLFSLCGTAISDLIIAVYYFLDEKTSISMKSDVWIMYIGVVALCIMSNVGLVQLMHTIKAEFFPSHTRGRGSAVTSLTAALCTFLQLRLYTTITDMYGVYLNFVIFAIFAIISAMFVLNYVTEPAGKTLAEIHEEIKTVTSKEAG